MELIKRNLTRQHLSFDFTSSVQAVLKKYGIGDSVEVELQFVGKTRMRSLNKAYRKKDYPTDVLSFPIWPDLDTIKKQQTRGPISLGTIVVCIPVAQTEAKKDRETLEQKITFLIEHSLLHLMGFHHEGD